MPLNSRFGSDLRRLSVGAALAIAVVGGGGALATAEPAGSEQPAASEQEALDAARQALMGATVQSIELDTADGTPKWEVDVQTREGGAYEVTVDAQTGTVLSIDQDSD